MTGVPIMEVDTARPNPLVKYTWGEDVYREDAKRTVAVLTQRLSRNDNPEGSRYVVGFRRGSVCGRVGIYLEVPTGAKAKAKHGL